MEYQWVYFISSITRYYKLLHQRKEAGLVGDDILDASKTVLASHENLLALGDGTANENPGKYIVSTGVPGHYMDQRTGEGVTPQEMLLGGQTPAGGGLTPGGLMFGGETPAGAGTDAWGAGATPAGLLMGGAGNFEKTPMLPPEEMSLYSKPPEGVVVPPTKANLWDGISDADLREMAGGETIMKKFNTATHAKDLDPRTATFKRLKSFHEK